MMMDVSTGGASSGASGRAVDSEPCPPASLPVGVTGADSISSSPTSSSENNNGGKRIGLSMTAMHLAMRDTWVSCAGEGCSDTGS